MSKILIINGPNLNLLGSRDPKIYGNATLAEINSSLSKVFSKKHKLNFFQSNHEGALIDCLHEAAKKVDGIIINAGALSHYSHAIRDAIESINVPCVEVHISNISAREEFRRHSTISSVCIGQISGFGAYGYELAVQAIIQYLAIKKPS